VRPCSYACGIKNVISRAAASLLQVWSRRANRGSGIVAAAAVVVGCGWLPADYLKCDRTFHLVCYGRLAMRKGPLGEWIGEQEGSKLAAIPGYGGQRAAIKVPGRAISSHIAKR
jgi:hypothetical protein